MVRFVPIWMVFRTRGHWWWNATLTALWLFDRVSRGPWSGPMLGSGSCSFRFSWEYRPLCSGFRRYGHACDDASARITRRDWFPPPLLTFELEARWLFSVPLRVQHGKSELVVEVTLSNSPRSLLLHTRNPQS